MANLKVRVTALTTLESGRPVAPGDEISISAREGDELIARGRAIALPAPKPKPKTTEKKEVSDAATGA